jgi:hypothetical protein
MTQTRAFTPGTLRNFLAHSCPPLAALDASLPGWNHPAATVEYVVSQAPVPCSAARFTCECGAAAVEYDLSGEPPPGWSVETTDVHLCPHCAARRERSPG